MAITAATVWSPAPSEAIGLDAHQEARPELRGEAEELVNVTLSIADMDTAPGLADQGVGLAKVFQPAIAFLCLDRHPGRIDLALERGRALNLSRVQNFTAVSPRGRPCVVAAKLERISNPHTVCRRGRPALSLPLLMTLVMPIASVFSR